MADYYQHAWLTIAATATTKAGGLFGPLKARDVARVVQLPYRDHDGNHKNYLNVQHFDEALLRRDYERGLRRSELRTRSWVFQEMRLSRRLLFFSPLGVYVKCAAMKTEAPATHGDNRVSQ